jgi:hypothetical protein
MSRLTALLVAASLGLSAAAPAHCALAAEVAEPAATAPADPAKADHHALHGHHARSDADDGESGDPTYGSPDRCPILAVCAAPALPSLRQAHATDVTRAPERVRTGSHSPSPADLGTDPPPPRPSPHA